MRSAGTSNQMLMEIVLERIFAIRRITRRDQQLLMSALMSKKGLNENDQQQIGRVFDALQRGLIKVVD
ncbi:hypothetical protein Cylst_3457 [Cylindrospermum stagnale PCC 7417]|uniref:Uncharacterized protein n=1 Tax=Cylindrospermum stagnale PCC 7417 TaxID=56107 RepID=K9WZ25_9NOST|nr:hypothetical protein [Cylindrospermum stagnale]AFZ25605.1 hypothetical protein Cylst_3457 [Cylindrospermum stagnale PCC 7417]